MYFLGLFTRFNYFTAQIDIFNNSARIVTIGVLKGHCGVACIGLKEDYGFHEHFYGCIVTEPELTGIKMYNKEIEKYLNKRNGKNWKEKYLKELKVINEKY